MHGLDAEPALPVFTDDASPCHEGVSPIEALDDLRALLKIIHRVVSQGLGAEQIFD